MQAISKRPCKRRVGNSWLAKATQLVVSEGHAAVVSEGQGRLAKVRQPRLHVAKVRQPQLAKVRQSVVVKATQPGKTRHPVDERPGKLSFAKAHTSIGDQRRSVGQNPWNDEVLGKVT